MRPHNILCKLERSWPKDASNVIKSLTFGRSSLHDLLLNMVMAAILDIGP